MRAMATTTRWGRAAIAAGSMGVLAATVGCGVTREATSAPAQTATAAASQTGLPIVVSCEPTQRTIVRPTIVNGTAMSQVECVAGEAVAAPVATAAAPIASVPAMTRALRPQPAYRDVADTEVVPVATRASAAPVRARQIVYEQPRARRSVKKSAVIIGSSAGVGAGVGAAVGGKKGALLGAVIGGGGATLWDQVTRRKN